MREVVANDQEQTFILAGPVTIKGSVTDSRTGEMIKRFKLTPGAHWSEGGHRSMWQPSESGVKWFTDGRYSYTFDGTARPTASASRRRATAVLESRFVDANEAGSHDRHRPDQRPGALGFCVRRQRRARSPGPRSSGRGRVAIRERAGCRDRHLFLRRPTAMGISRSSLTNRNDPLVVDLRQGMGDRLVRGLRSGRGHHAEALGSRAGRSADRHETGGKPATAAHATSRLPKGISMMEMRPRRMRTGGSCSRRSIRGISRCTTRRMKSCPGRPWSCTWVGPAGPSKASCFCRFTSDTSIWANSVARPE